jgi:hypothetical protein
MVSIYGARLDEDKREWQDEKLRDAARTGNLEVIRSWPDDGAINATGQGGWTALHFAAREGRSDVRRMLRYRGHCEWLTPGSYVGGGGTAGSQRRPLDSHLKRGTASALRCGPSLLSN